MIRKQRDFLRRESPEMKEKSSPLILLCFALFFLFTSSSAIDTINATRSVKDGETVVSAGGSFELGFFSLGNSKNRYLGIWFKKILPTLTVVWVANRGSPLQDSSGLLRITAAGSLAVLNRTNGVVWSTNSSNLAGNPVAQLLNSGNLVVRDGNLIVWQSFDHPCDTLLPGMRIGVNKITGQKWFLSTWKSAEDPSPSDYNLGIDTNRYSQLTMWKNRVIQSQSGPWNGEAFNGEPGLKSTNPFIDSKFLSNYIDYKFVNNDREITYSYEVRNSSVPIRLIINPVGMMQRYVWLNANQGWTLFSTAVFDNCNRYAICGPYTSCNINSFQICGCLEGFQPKLPVGPNTVDWSKGCVRKTQLDCARGDVFRHYSGLKLPDTYDFWYNGSMSLEACRIKCLNNCSCTAYANPHTREGGSGCLIWYGDLIDMRVISDNPQDIYVRIAASEIEAGVVVNSNGKSHGKKRVKIIAVPLAILGIVVLLPVLYACWKKKHQQIDGRDKEDLELPFFDLATIAAATDNFSFRNLLGEGGFGPVYKGVLKDGQEIAVKRLSRSSKQGVDEFKNEVIHIAKLQHRNLVKLLGYCIKLDERILIYEHVPNNSLGSVIFDPKKSMILDWHKRFNIINGIARGLLYLHQDSRLRIIHRDLKAGNILLDNEMNPKISDFGLSRSFGANETEANTGKVVGTYGYMSPEYAIDGIYSVKSDVYSFGVLLLEIVTGKRNRGFHHEDHNLNLLGHAWKLHMEERPLKLIDPGMRNLCSPLEATRSIHVGLLCVQRRPEDRPIMSYVVLMLSGDGILPPPKQPGFFNERNPFDANSSSSQLEGQSTANDISTTLINPR